VPSVAGPVWVKGRKPRSEHMFSGLAPIAAGKIEASFAKGVLNVKLPKTAEAQKSEKTISVKAA
jgi:HSP20 family molecular chaperone IbpA